MDDDSKQILAQLASVVIQSIFTYLTQKGMSEEDIDQLFAKERQKFKDRNPSTLPDA